MAVRPPQDDDDEPDALEFGIAALDAYLDRGEVQFPATADEVVDALGDPEIPYDAGGNGVRLSKALEAVPRDRFESESQFLELLHPVFEDYRSKASNSIIRQLRAMLPF
jgi:hypothetical protein